MRSMVPYEHRVQYYETDGMGCVHHSNYLRWFEEARGHYMRVMGFPYEEVEAAGLASPVTAAQLEYRSMCRYGDCAVVETVLERYTGSRAAFRYRVVDRESGVLRCEGRTEHCFLNGGGRPVSLRRALPDTDEKMKAAAAGEEPA